MSISGETVFSVLAGGLISGLITWRVAEGYFQKQDRRSEQIAGLLARFFENQRPATSLRFGRDSQSRIQTLHFSNTLEPGAYTVTGVDATFRGPDDRARNSSESGKHWEQ